MRGWCAPPGRRRRWWRGISRCPISTSWASPIQEEDTMSAFSSDLCPAWAGNRRGRRGYVLLTPAAMVLLVLVPAIGLSIDVGMMYLVQARLSGASDAAALAGARALARGTDDSTHRSTAESTANTYFYSNFPTRNFASTTLPLTNLP